MTADDVQRWLDAYVAAWASYDEAEITALFTDDCAYRYDPFAEPLVGGAAIAADWLKDRDAPGSWEAEYRAVRRRRRRARLPWARRGTRRRASRYANMYLLEFAADGRCSSFTEWFFLERK